MRRRWAPLASLNSVSCDALYNILVIAARLQCRVRFCRIKTAATVALLILASNPQMSVGQVPIAQPLLDPLCQAIGAEDYAKAKTLADAVVQTAGPQDRLKISLLYGRVLLGLKLKEPARQYLQLMQKQELDAAGQSLLKVYAAWFQSLEDGRDDAITALEEILQKGAKSESTLEAADVLSILYLERGDREDAKRAVDFGLALAKYLSVQGVRTDYLEALLRRRLQGNDPSAEAEGLYRAAEALRQQEKFAEAGKLFTQIIQQHARSEWFDPARFRIGQCLVGIDRPDLAIEHWKKFVTERPEGPFRGQAYVALVDVALEKKANLALAVEQAQGAIEALSKPHDAGAKKSWDEAAYDIYIRKGIVDLVDHHFDQAVRAFEQARQALPKEAPETVTGGLARLIDASHNQASLLPSELASGDAATVLFLSVANLYSTLYDFVTAERYYTVPFAGQGRSSSNPHHAFAAFGLARSKASIYRPSETPQSRLEAAKALLETSLKEYPRGSWHDETLYRLAITTQELAETKYGRNASKLVDNVSGPSADTKNASEPKDAKPSEKIKKALTPQQQEEAKAKAEKERIASLLKAKREAATYWQRILDRYPKSPRVEHAIYFIGLLRYEAAAAAPLSEAKKRWQEAASTFGRLCDNYPESTHAGDAYVRQIDIVLEQTFDFPQAISLADRAVEWAKHQKVEITTTPDGRPTADSFAAAAMLINGATASLPAWGESGEQRSATLLDDLYNLYLRAGMIAYLQDDYKQAAEFLNAAGPARPHEGMQGNFNTEKIGVHILANSCKRGQPAWNDEAIKEAKTDDQKLALKLADTYLHAQRPEKAQAIYERLLSTGSAHGREAKAIEGYCLMQLALTYSNQTMNHEKSIEYYKQFYRKEYASLPWAPVAIMRLGVLEYNKTQDSRRAMRHYQHVLDNYPNHPEAERALYFIAINSAGIGDKALAEASCNAFIQKYPKSGWRNHVQTVLIEEVSKLQLTGREQ